MTSGRRVFQQHTERTEGSDTTPRLAHSESTERRVYKPQLRQKRKDHAARRGRDAFGTATRISASLFRRLSAFFESTPGQDPKAAKFAVLTSGHAGFPKRVERSEVEMSRNVQSGNTQNLKSMVIQRSFPKWSVAERRKTAAASNQAAVCACAHSRYFAGGSPSGLRV